jgi:hypothetical protein
LRTVRVWEGKTPTGYPLLVERVENGPWVVTVAAVSRSRNASLEAALLEAGGDSVSRDWAAQLTAAVEARAAAMLSERTTHTSRKKAS